MLILKFSAPGIHENVYCDHKIAWHWHSQSKPAVWALLEDLHKHQDSELLQGLHQIELD